MKSRPWNPCLRVRCLSMLACAGLLASCAPSHDGFGYKKELHPMDVRNYTDPLIDHDQPGWDHVGLWRRREGKPPVFVPADMPTKAPVDDANGFWTVDAADGSRFFVPKGGTRRYSEGLLKAEAMKATNRLSKRRNAWVNVLGVLVFWPLGTAGAAVQSIQLP